MLLVANISDNIGVIKQPWTSHGS